MSIKKENTLAVKAHRLASRFRQVKSDALNLSSGYQTPATIAADKTNLVRARWWSVKISAYLSLIPRLRQCVSHSLPADSDSTRRCALFAQVHCLRLTVQTHNWTLGRSPQCKQTRKQQISHIYTSQAPVLTRVSTTSRDEFKIPVVRQSRPVVLFLLYV